MPEQPSRQSPERRAARLTERILGIVPVFAQRIGRAKSEEERRQLVTQIGKELDELGRYVMKPMSEISDRATFYMQRDFVSSTLSLQDAIVMAEMDAEPLNPKIVKLLEARAVPNEGLERVNHELMSKIEKIQDLIAPSGGHINPAWGQFLFHMGFGRALMGNFQADDWYGEVMGEGGVLIKKMVLPLVVVDQVEVAARERAKPMVTQRIVEEAVHRAKNALEELIEIWDKELPALANTYRLVTEALDQEVENLSLFYRYQARQK